MLCVFHYRVCKRIMVFDSVMTNYPPFYDLSLMVFNLLSHPGSSFLGSTPLEIVAEGIEYWKYHALL